MEYLALGLSLLSLIYLLLFLAILYRWEPEQLPQCRAFAYLTLNGRRHPFLRIKLLVLRQISQWKTVKNALIRSIKTFFQRQKLTKFT